MKVRARESQKFLLTLKVKKKEFSTLKKERNKSPALIPHNPHTDRQYMTPLLWFGCICHNRTLHGVFNSLASLPAAARCFLVSDLCG